MKRKTGHVDFWGRPVIANYPEYAEDLYSQIMSKQKENPLGDNIFGLNEEDALSGALGIIGNTAGSILEYRQAKENYKTEQANALNEFKMSEENAAFLRQLREQEDAENLVEAAGSGLDSGSFSEMFTWNLLESERRIAEMKNEMQASAVNRMNDAIRMKSRAKRGRNINMAVMGASIAAAAAGGLSAMGSFGGGTSAAGTGSASGLPSSLGGAFLNGIGAPGAASGAASAASGGARAFLRGAAPALRIGSSAGSIFKKYRR